MRCLHQHRISRMTCMSRNPSTPPPRRSNPEHLPLVLQQPPSQQRRCHRSWHPSPDDKSNPPLTHLGLELGKPCL